MLTKTIKISGKDVVFRASAAIPRLYRIKFGRDIYKDMKVLCGNVENSDPEESTLDVFSLEMFENIAYLMAKHADKNDVPDTVEEWLENFDTFSIYEVLPELVELWGMNIETQSESKKKLEKLTGK